MKATLTANYNWQQNNNIVLPKVTFEIHFENGDALLRFEVFEPKDCYMAHVTTDGGPCYKDSCVEIFLDTKDGAYENFEFNSLGKCLAAKGKDRYTREPFTPKEYEKIERHVELDIKDNVHWILTARIPKSLGILNKGNAYKCGDLAKTPHYLTLFPITSEKPDFHRPEFFKEFV